MVSNINIKECCNKFLRHEIDILNTDRVYCVRSKAYDRFKELVNIEKIFSCKQTIGISHPYKNNRTYQEFKKKLLKNLTNYKFIEILKIKIYNGVWLNEML